MNDDEQPSKDLKPSILVIDDDPINSQGLRAVIPDLDLNLVAAHSGEEALRWTQSHEFAAITLDVRLPGIDGFETARLLRKEGRNSHTPILFLTAYDVSQAELEKGYLLGAVDFLIKPVPPVILKAKLRALVDLFNDRQRVLQEAHEFRMLIQGTKEYAIFMLDPEGKIVTWNPGAERIKGYQANEIIGQHFSRFYPQSAIDSGWPDFELTVARSSGRFEDEGWRVKKDGSTFWANVVITALFDEAGVLRGFSKITRDLTDRRNAEENARRLLRETAVREAAEENAMLIEEQREKLQVTLASIGDAVISTDAEGRIVFLNSVAERLTGWPQAEAFQRPLSEVFKIVNEYSREPVENPAIRVLKEGLIVGLANHTVLITRDGTERPIDDSAAPVKNSKGQLFGAVLVFRDITQRRRAEELARESEIRKSAILETALDCIISINYEGKVIEFNPSSERLFGFSRNEVLGKELCELIIPPSLREQHRRGMAHYLATGDGPILNRRLEMTALRADGSEIDVELSITSTLSCGAPIFTAYLRDISERKRTEQSLRFLADASAVLADLTDDQSTLQKVAVIAVPQFADWCAVDVLDSDGSLRRVAVVHADPQKVKLAEELHREFPQEPESVYGLPQVLRTGKSDMMSDISEELLLAGAKNERHYQLLRELGFRSYMCVPLQGHGKLLGAVSFVSAESGRCYTKDDLAFAEELARRATIAMENARLYVALQDADRRKDEFLATLAHELRNPLAPIRNSLEVLKMPRVDFETGQKTIEMMDRQIHHLVRLVDDLLDVARVMRGKIELHKEPVELTTVVARAVETVQSIIDAQGHDLRISLTTDSLLLNADPVRLVQVIGNLLANAAKYTQPNGTIWVTAERDGNTAMLNVRDTGIGIAADMLPHIFDLFVQGDSEESHSQGGLGIGLTLARNLVKYHDGTIEARSRGLGEGSEFTVRLPLLTAKLLPDQRDGDEPSKPAAAGRRLLVVDDHIDAANSLALWLSLQGHEVQVAYNGMDALKLVEEKTPDLIFLDIGMAGVDGYEVARRIRRHPKMRQIVLAALTGWGQESDRRRSAEAGFDYHIVKPPDHAIIDRIIRAVTPSSDAQENTGANL